MANYVKSTNFTVKDSLSSGNPAKIVKGTEIDTEFNAIASAIASKPDADSPTLTGTPLAPTATAATNNTQIATTAFVKNAVDTAVGAIDAGVLTFSAGTTGFTPSTATTGAVTLSGTLAVSNGGTGQTSYTDGQLLIGNSTGNTLAKGTLTAGTGISVTNGAGSITIANTLPSSVNAQVFTSNGTFTIPSGVTKLKVTVVGGGGGYGGSGGTSSVASGTQSITTISATGGANTGVGGLGSNGDLNIRGGGGGAGSYGTSNVPAGNGGSSILGGGGPPGGSGGNYGGGAGGRFISASCGFIQGELGMGAGGAAIKWLTVTGGTLTVTVGAGGVGGSPALSGSSGFVIFEWC